MTYWRPISTAPLDGSDILLLAHGMVIEARFDPGGGWTEDTPICPAEYEGAVWVAFDDAVEFEIEECHPDARFWHHGPVTHWMPKPPMPEMEPEQDQFPGFEEMTWEIEEAITKRMRPKHSTFVWEPLA